MLLPFEVSVQTQVFHSARTVGSGVTQHLAVTLISPDVLNAMELILQITTERRHGIVWRTKKIIKQPPKKVNHVLTSSNA